MTHDAEDLWPVNHGGRAAQRGGVLRWNRPNNLFISACATWQTDLRRWAAAQSRNTSSNLLLRKEKRNVAWCSCKCVKSSTMQEYLHLLGANYQAPSWVNFWAQTPRSVFLLPQLLQQLMKGVKIFWKKNSIWVAAAVLCVPRWFPAGPSVFSAN